MALLREQPWASGIVQATHLMARIRRANYDHQFGARPLQRVIEQRVAVPLARWRVANPKANNTTLHLELNEQGMLTVKSTSD